MKKIIFLLSILFISCETQKSEIIDLFNAENNPNVSCYRIPSIITAVNGDLIAMIDERVPSCGDLKWSRDINIVMRKSFDNGKTWTDIETVVDYPLGQSASDPSMILDEKNNTIFMFYNYMDLDNEKDIYHLRYKKSVDNGKSWSSLKVIWDDGGNTCGNPSPVMDKKSGRISLLATWNRGEDKEWQIIDQKSIDTRHVYLIHSNDNGESWTNPKEITSDVKLDSWTWYATGPVNGIQLKKGPNKERLIIPCDHIEADTKHYYSHIIYSDDGGLNWNLGGSTKQHQVNECTIIEFKNGDLLLNMRNYT